MSAPPLPQWHPETLSTSDQWGFEIAADRLIEELRELLRDRNAKEVADLMKERRRRPQPLVSA
jgi:hypothetical protein